MVVEVTEHQAIPLSPDVPAFPFRNPRYVTVAVEPVDAANEWTASDGNVLVYVVDPDPVAKFVVLFVIDILAYDVYAASLAVAPLNVSSSAAVHSPA